MKVENCIHCGTPNLISNKSIGIPKCIKCGKPITIGDTMIDSLFEAVPEKAAMWFVIILLLGILAFFGVIFYHAL